MEYTTEIRRLRYKSLPWVLLIVALGTAINLLGVRLAQATGWPVYLDSIGTMLAGAMGGYIPGMAVGFLTNVINGIGDYTTAYYGSLNVMIALLAAYFARRGYWKRISRLPLIALAFALVGGGLGSVLTWFLYGGGFGEGISAPLAHAIHEGGLSSVFLSQLSADMAVDLLDKAVSVALTAAALRLVPEAAQRRFQLNGWHQEPLSQEVSEAVKRGRFVRRLSLRGKLLLLIASATMVVAAVVTAISFIQFHNATIDMQVKLGHGVTNVVASNVDPSRVDEYLEKGEAAEGYLVSKRNLSNLMNSTPDIEYVYVYRIQPDGCHVVFDPDTPDTPGAAPGTVIPFDDAFRPYLNDLLEGREIAPVISNETYGWLLTVYRPVYDEQGICQCYAAVDISMEELVAGERVYLTRVLALFAGFFILILALSVWLAEYHVILPINTMAMAAGKFAYNSETARSDSLEQIRSLKICTGDEIENLYHAMTATTEDTVKYIADAQRHSETISKLQNGMIMVLADMVESRDQCTGDHVRKTAAYAGIIMEQMRRDGVYADQLTDEFVSDVVNSAPLHDVGKIHVPDAVLNKPGRLTDEEFALMREHTTAGGEIITRAMGVVSEEDSGYLKEARNLANYHHEKWNGAGYPRGLKGEEIPLSARIMAVADVFDALVSRRSYKPGFPFEKAMDIIREGIGTHFDPLVAEAFLKAEDEVRAVAEKNMDV